MFEGRVVIITGAARGLGRAYAQRAAADGGAIVAGDLDADGSEETAALVRNGGGRALAVALDVTDEASTLALAKAATDAFGRVDILVNNAAIWGDLQRAPLVEVQSDYWDLVMAVNVKGPLLCSRAVIPFMREQRWGRIINVSSMGAYMAAGVYGVSKLAVNQLTWALATEVGSDGITVNAVAPGTIDNEPTRRQVPAGAMEGLVAKNIVPRAGTADDVYGLIRYLASDDAAWVTGQTFLVNGGFNTRF